MPSPLAEIFLRSLSGHGKQLANSAKRTMTSGEYFPILAFAIMNHCLECQTKSLDSSIIHATIALLLAGASSTALALGGQIPSCP
ncbi:hypothetical protein M0804_013111 [Polistes exclamans]|nr:hypothetical protein M0804_013111 [Polistes exclamans]